MNSLNSLRSLAVIGLSSVMLASCHFERDYAINGTIDYPSQMPYGDTIISIPSLDGQMVYLQDLDGTPFDSCMVEDGHFHFEGKVRTGEEYFAYIFGIYFSSLIAIEPGECEYYAGFDSQYATGTPANDCLTQLQSALTMNENLSRTRIVSVVDSLQNLGEQVSDSLADALLLPLYDEFNANQQQIFDELYDENKDNIGSVYVALCRHIEQVESADELEEALSEYPDRVLDNELTQAFLRMMRVQGEMMGMPDDASMEDETFFE